MKTFTLFVLAGIVSAAMYFGYIFVVQKSMRLAPQQTIKDNPLEEVQRQKTRTEDTWERQKRMMEEQRQKMRDMQRR